MKFLLASSLLALSAPVLAEPLPIAVIQLDGTYEELDPKVVYYDKESHIVYGPLGKRYMYAGQKKDIGYNKDGTPKMIKISCVNSELWNDPDVPPPLDAKLPGEGCQLQEISPYFELEDKTEFIPLIHFDWEKKREQDIKSLNGSPATSRAMACQLFPGYAPPLAWGPYAATVSHVGRIAYSFTVRPTSSNTQVENSVRYFHINDWNEYNWFGRGTITIIVGNAVASVFMKYRGNPFGTTVETQIC